MNRKADRQTDRRTQGEKQFFLPTLSGGGIIIHQNETKKRAHISQLSELNTPQVELQLTTLRVVDISLKDVMDFRDGYKTYKK